MEKTITIDNKEVRLNNNAAWAMEYKDQFGRDIVPVLLPAVATIIEGMSSMLNSVDDVQNITVKTLAEAFEGRTMEILLPMYQIELVDVVINVTWALAKCADERIPEPKRWIRQFDEFPLDVIVPEVYELIMQGFASSKNWKRLEGLKDNLKDLQPLHSTK